MFARKVTIHLRPNMLSDYTQTFEKDALPLLRKQNGFKDEMTFSSPGGTEVTAISLWDNKANADAYNECLPRGVEGAGPSNRWNAQGADR
jgi:hypothetical protein